MKEHISAQKTIRKRTKPVWATSTNTVFWLKYKEMLVVLRHVLVGGTGVRKHMGKYALDVILDRN